jgi:hypothetical protein
MSTQSDRIFRKEFAKHFTNHHANFPPTQPVEVGDFGVIENGYFRKLGGIKSVFEIDFEPIPDPDPTNEEFKSDNSVTVSLVAKGDITTGGTPAIKASLDLGFSSSRALFFNAAKVSYIAIKDLVSVGDKILELKKSGKWKKNYVLVSSVLKADRVILVISGSSNASITIEAKSDAVPKVDLADLGVKLEVKRSSNVAYQVVADQNLVIGFALSRVYNRIFQDPIFKAKQMVADQAALLDFKTNDNDELVFGNISPFTAELAED